jgi:hypothetical protein
MTDEGQLEARDLERVVKGQREQRELKTRVVSESIQKHCALITMCSRTTDLLLLR